MPLEEQGQVEVVNGPCYRQILLKVFQQIQLLLVEQSLWLDFGEAMHQAREEKRGKKPD